MHFIDHNYPNNSSQTLFILSHSTPLLYHHRHRPKGRSTSLSPAPNTIATVTTFSSLRPPFISTNHTDMYNQRCSATIITSRITCIIPIKKSLFFQIDTHIIPPRLQEIVRCCSMTFNFARDLAPSVQYQHIKQSRQNLEGKSGDGASSENIAAKRPWKMQNEYQTYVSIHHHV